MSSIFKSGVATTIDGKVRNLVSPDYPPTILLQKGKRPLLCVIRNGNSTGHLISRKVAEELIASGMSYGD